MRLPMKSAYALRALYHLARSGHTAAHVIAHDQRIPARYLEELIACLRKAGLVVGKRGPRGGYKLGRPADQITVNEVLAALASASDTPEGQGVERTVVLRLEAALEGLTLSQLTP